MVHLVFHLSNQGDHQHHALIEGIQAFIKHHHNYEPINTHEGNHLERHPDTGGTRDPMDYPRTSNLLEKDEWGRGKAYIEYGWHRADDATDRSIQSFQGHWMEHNSFALPLHPADIIHELRVRHITDWSAKEQAELEKFISGMIDEIDGAYKTRDEYTEEEVSWWMSALDYGTTCGKVKAGECSSVQNLKDAWVCRICKAILENKTLTSHNPAPLPFPPEDRVCEGCNSAYVLAGRMGSDPFKSFECVDGDQKAIKCPLIYPKPKMTRAEMIAKRTDPQGMFMIGGDGKMKWDTAEALRRNHSAQLTALTCANVQLYKELKQAREMSKTERHWQEAFDNGYKEGRHIATEALVEEGERVKGMAKELIERQKHLDAENARLEEQAKSVKQAMERVKQANAPMDKKVQQLKADIVRRDNKIASMKWMEGYVADMPPKMRLKMCLRQMMRQRSQRAVSPVVGWVNELPAWAITDYRHEASLRAKVSAPVQRKKKVVVEHPCVICEKKFPKNSLVEQYGDLFCRQCK